VSQRHRTSYPVTPSCRTATRRSWAKNLYLSSLFSFLLESNNGSNLAFFFFYSIFCFICQVSVTQPPHAAWESCRPVSLPPPAFGRPEAEVNNIGAVKREADRRRSLSVITQASSSRNALDMLSGGRLGSAVMLTGPIVNVLGTWKRRRNQGSWWFLTLCRKHYCLLKLTLAAHRNIYFSGHPSLPVDSKGDLTLLCSMRVREAHYYLASLANENQTFFFSFVSWFLAFFSRFFSRRA